MAGRDRWGRGWALAAALAVVLAAPLAGCGSDDDGGGDVATFDEEGFPFTFEYPSDLEQSDDPEFAGNLGAAADESLGFGIDGQNAIILQRFTLSTEVDEGNLDLAEREFDSLLASVDPEATGESGEIAGFPSLTYEDVSIPDPPEAVSDFYILFEGDQEYVINCQSTPEERETIDDACVQALDSLEPK